VTKTAELWKFAGEDYGVSVSSVAVHDGLLYSTEYAGYVNCIEVETGKRHWRHDLLTPVWGSPLVADGKVYVRTGEENVVVYQEGRTMKVLAKPELPGTSQGVVVPSDGVFYVAGHTRLWAIAEPK